MIEGHGDDLYLYRGKVRHNFSSNILQNVDHTALAAWLGSQPGLLTSYPDPAPEVVERKLESIHGLPRGTVMVTAGATDAIYMIARRYGGMKSYIFRPTFSEYGDACRMYGHVFTALGEADLVWLCNPNNPDGCYRDRLPEVKPGAVTVVDAAYSDYSVRPTLTPSECVSRGDVLMLSSLTKRFSVPGLRVGYVVGHPGLIAPLKELRMPWSVCGMSIAASMRLLDRMDEYPIDAAGLHDEALRIAAALRGMGFAVSDTVCNFFLATLPAGSSSELKNWLVERHGLLIRDASNMTGNPADIRIAAQTRHENDLLINAISQWISSRR